MKEEAMRPTKLMNHLDEEGLKKQMKASVDRGQFQRWQAIFLTSKGLSSEVVAEYVGTTKGTVHQWVYQYNHNGSDGILLQGRGGRRFGLLTLDEERDLLEQVRSKAEQGRILTAYAVRDHIEEKTGKAVSEDYLYDILHRHGWRKVMPRPQHPKADKEKQENFKKNSRSWWQAPQKTSAKKTPGQ
jgi:transposase